MRIYPALLLSAVTAAVLLMVLNIATDFPQSLKQGADIQFDFFGFAFVLAAIVALFLGLPAFLIAKRFKVANVWTSALAGLAIGCLFSHLFLNRPVMVFEEPLTSHAEPLAETIWTYLAFGGTGLASGLVFWFVWSFKRRKTTPLPELF